MYPPFLKSRPVACICLLALAACTPPSKPPPPKDMRAENEANVRMQVESFKKAIEAHDTDRILSFYTADGWQLPLSGEIAKTQADRQNLWKSMERLPIARDAVDVEDRIEVAQSGDLAVQYGEFRQVWTEVKGGYKSVPQKFMTVWRKQPDGSWKISASMATVANP